MSRLSASDVPTDDSRAPHPPGRERRMGRGTWETERRSSDRRISDRRETRDLTDRSRGGSGPADVPAPVPMTLADLLTALDTVPDPLYVVDRHWRVRYLNAATARAWTRDTAAALGEILWTLHPPLLDGAIHDPLVEAMRERQTMRAVSAVAVPGDVVTAYPTGDGLLVVHGADDTHRSLDAERAARAEAEAQREEAQRLAAELRIANETADGIRRAAERARSDAEVAARTKSDFMATMSHELRTPINAITGYTQLLDLGIAGPVTDAQRGYLGRLYTSGRHLLGLVDDVLDLANLERGRLSVARDRLTTGSVVGAALALVAPDAAARSIRLLDERDGGDDGEDGLPFVGDEHRVRQILLNLLSNAVKFTAPGGTVTVRVARVTRRVGTAAASSPSVGITVQDTGIGIAPEQQGAIFEPFTQADSSHTRTAGGTGLGLTVSRRLAHLMQGDLTVDSQLGGGSSFTLFLPADSSATTASLTPPRGVHSVTDGPQTRNPVDESKTVSAVEVGAQLREHLEPLIDGFIARLRSDPIFGAARALSRAQLEDHTLSMLGALVHALVVVEEGGGVEGDVLRDGSAIQEHIAFRHGEQRFRLGFTSPMLAQEYAILTEEVLALARRVLPDDDEGAHRLIDVLQRLLDRASEMSTRGFEHAQRFAYS